ncbi:MAG: Gfo/Idh/MocA family oxidoreductase [Candidatus Dadabacteria bacterium]
MKKINTAILSYGMSGQLFHAPFIELHEGFELYAVWERSKNLAEQKYNNIKTYRTLEELLGDDRIELVVVNTPNNTHYEYAKKALNANKHVVVEKPFVVTVEEGEELISLAKQKGKILTVYQNRRFDSDYRAVKKIVEEGLLGEVVEAEFHFDRYKQVVSPKAHKEIPGPGTGSLYDLGSHIIDQALQLFGSPDKIFADIRIIRPISLVDDYFELLLYYKNLRVRLHSSYLVAEPLPAYILHGSKGSFIKAKTDIQETALQAGKWPGSADWGVEPEEERGLLHIFSGESGTREFVSSSKGNYYDFYDMLFNSISSNLPVPVAPEEALEVIRIITAAYKSSHEQKVIEL